MSLVLGQATGTHSAGFHVNPRQRTFNGLATSKPYESNHVWVCFKGFCCWYSEAFWRILFCSGCSRLFRGSISYKEKYWQRISDLRNSFQCQGWRQTTRTASWCLSFSFFFSLGESCSCLFTVCDIIQSQGYLCLVLCSQYDEEEMARGWMRERSGAEF